MLKLAMLVVGGLLLFAPDARANFYSWVDRDGNQFYTNDPSKIPPEYRSRVSTVEPDAGRVNVGGTAAPAAGPRPAVAEHKDKYGKGERWWRDRASNLRRELRDLQDDYDLVLKQERELREKQKGQKKKKGSETQLAKKKAQLEKKMKQSRRKLEVDLPEEARRAEAYPGWIRE
ncbi:MAG: hypothetical protein A2X56_08155 [Nitrospirae bacterium GWC2_57_13]|jgi:hypothetical protein|nr:MAG: hypothetical protein A2X56_08155 [Nitrospirae bacterium GWC2_57_13]